MQHVEFLDTDHFHNNYHRVPPAPQLAHFIDFFWETKFNHLWKQYPEGFSDVLFPNIGYTYLVNLGTPFVMQVDDEQFIMKTDGFLPRHASIECHHQPGNILFGIKFRISPIIFEKKVNFSEYRRSIFPLSYLIDKDVVMQVKDAPDFKKRVAMLNQYFGGIVAKFDGSLRPITIVSEIINACNKENNFTISIEEMAVKYALSTRTLQRYFENATSLSSKKTLQILRIRKAVEQLALSAAEFDYKDYGYYDYSHFHKHLRKFLHKNALKKLLSNSYNH
ncbi:MAG: hypothetical protein JWQ27_1523 [Ferruginibacter sp.]|nr:hypothetical protein [Ferruginibacter sp.]